jgi:hypothetical protein
MSYDDIDLGDHWIPIEDYQMGGSGGSLLTGGPRAVSFVVHEFKAGSQ